ncbi:MAG TPA: hypothetical protein ENF79_04875 [Nitrososphaeria archaeon]|nr:hypothetical protein [Nitrososphaeria archaeon]
MRSQAFNQISRPSPPSTRRHPCDLPPEPRIPRSPRPCTAPPSPLGSSRKSIIGSSCCPAP